MDLDGKSVKLNDVLFLHINNLCNYDLVNKKNQIFKMDEIFVSHIGGWAYGQIELHIIH